MKNGWELKKMNEVCELVNGRAYKQNELLKKGKYRVLRVGNFFTNKEWYYSDLELPENKYCDYGDLLYAWSASFGPRIWNEEKVIYHYHIWKVIPNENRVTKDFLYKLLEWDVEKIKEDHGTGTTMMHVGKGSMDERMLPIPSLPEQKRIVAILDKAFAAIDKAKANAEKNLQNAKDLFESYLQNVFANQTVDWTNETLDNLLAKGWIVSHLDGNHGGEYPKREEFKSKGVPYISANCIKGTEVDFSLSKFLTPERALTIRKGIAVNNDVLFAHNATVGPVALLRTNEKKVILGTSLTYYRCNLNFILPKYLVNYMRSKEFKKQYEVIMRQSTRNQVPLIKTKRILSFNPPY
ncbi:MAG: restriction endonuclease subunit S [Saprospiraceae bacterium]|nr:restriction endonuclease subunit S [Saprospiraceae bacterium]